MCSIGSGDGEIVKAVETLECELAMFGVTQRTRTRSTHAGYGSIPGASA